VDAGLSEERLREFLWLLNAHPQLTSFVHVCINLSESLRALQRQRVRFSDYGIEEWPKIVEWVKKGASSFREYFDEEFFHLPKTSSHHPLSYKGLGRHGVYCLFCNAHEHERYRGRYSLLLGHLLLAHVESMREFVPLYVWEHYQDEAEILYDHRPVYAATLALRELSLAKHLDHFLAVARAMPTSHYLAYIEGIRPADFGEFARHIGNLRNFLLNRCVRKRSRKREDDEEGGGRGPVESGHIGIATDDTDDFDLGDPDDPAYDWKRMEVIGRGADPARLDEDDLEAAGEDVPLDELAADDDILLGEQDCESARKGLAGIVHTARAQMRHRSMVNQLLPWSYGLLTTSEYTELVRMFDERFQELEGRCDEWTEEESLEAETIVMVSICFWLGCGLEAVHGMHVISRDHNPPCQLGLYERRRQGESVGYEWRVRSINVEHFTDRADSAVKSKPRVDYVSLPDLVGLAKKFGVIRKRRPGKNTEFFGRPLEEYRQAFRKLLQNMRHGERITITKIERFLFHQVVMRVGDVVVAAAITGQHHWLTRVRAHYSTLDLSFLRGIYAETVREIVAKTSLTPSGPRMPPPNLSNKHVGSRMCPRFDTVVEVVANMKRRLKSCPAGGLQRIWEYHNRYTIYTVYLFGFATACRAIVDPLRRVSIIDGESGLAVLPDKEDEYGSKSRPLWIPGFVRKQLESYERHRAWLFENGVVANPADAERWGGFFLDEVGRAERVRPRRIAELTERYFPFPANVHRRFVRTHLLESGCPPEVIDAWMGHWSLGQLPWGRFASLSYADYVAVLRAHLLPLLEELGWSHVPSLLAEEE